MDMVPSLAARLTAFMRGDPSQILDKQALREADQALQVAKDALAEGRGLLVDVVYVVAWLHWFRYQVLREWKELEAALPHFSVLAKVDRDWVPAPILSFLQRQSGQSGAQARQAFELLSRALENGSTQPLDQAIALLDNVLSVTPQDDPAIVDYLTNLGIALGARFGKTRLPEDINDCVAVFQEALRVIPNGHPDLADCLLNLGKALAFRFELSAETADLDAAIVYLHRVVAVTPDEHPSRVEGLPRLGSLLLARFEQTGAQADLDAAITRMRQAIVLAPDQLTPADNHSRLSNALRIRFGHTGAPDDMDAAVREGEEAVRLAPNGHPHLGAMLSNLGIALRVRFERTGALADGDAAIERLRQAVAVTSDRHDRAMCLSNLAAALSTRYDRTKALDDIDAAISTGEQAIQVAPEGFAGLSSMLNTLSGALLKRYEQTRAMSDIDAAISVSRRAVAAAASGHRLLGDCLSNLGGALFKRFDGSRAPDDINAAIACFREAVEVTPNGHPHLAGYLYNLGAVALSRFEHYWDTPDVDAAITAYDQAAAVTTAPATTRLRAARMAAIVSAAWHGMDSGLPRFQTALELLPLLGLRGLSIDDQQHMLQDAIASLGLDAAACANAAGQPGSAVEILEQGRSVLWGQVLDMRTDLGQLHQRCPELAAALLACRNVLDAPTDLSADVGSRSLNDTDHFVGELRAVDLP